MTNIELQKIEEFRNKTPNKIIVKHLEKIAKTYFVNETHNTHCFCGQSERERYKHWFYQTLNNYLPNDSESTQDTF
jgi:hypothetical protein